MRTFNRVGVYSLAVLLLIVFGASFSANAGSGLEKKTVDNIERITMSQVMGKMAEGESITFLDSRKAAAWQGAHTKLPDAIRVANTQELSQLDKEPPKGQLIVVYCT